ncbi:uncharacterized protein LOC127261878 [Andrographis paniculata]|uniref:uncharacterized protein LOC127261878 n=1 Tax=Andrographis paniculata TaxID=175694 RepID=UPI0021E74914|nr:uncharacterized protein LOC127261878 [Andrographis paniculata]XP_051146273.1 uncharacterized protein LOC127261878 [Andrographis paniculata]
MGSSTYKGNENFAKELEDELMKFTRKDVDYKVDKASNEQAGVIQRNTDVNIMECTKSSGSKLFEEKCQDTTESSSSFGDSGIESVDSEAMSDFCDDAGSTPKFGRFDERFLTRKKLTTEWRSSIQPLVWRCKWTELQIKKLQSLAQRYDQELEAQNKQKRKFLENSELDNGVKSLPYPCGNSNVLKRKKRRKTEMTMDVTAYMSRHNLFSYYENRKSFSSECAIVSDVRNNTTNHSVNADGGFCSNDDLLSFELFPGDRSSEQVLWKIYHLQSRVGQLKDRVDRVTTENADKLSSSDILNFLPTQDDDPTPKDGDRVPVGTYIASQLINMDDARMTDKADTSYADIPDANARISRAGFANAYGNVEDWVLIDNQRVKEELNNFEGMTIPPFEKSTVNTVKEDISSSEDVKIHPIQNPILNDVPGNGSPSLPKDQPDAPKDEQQHPPKIRSLAKLTSPKRMKRGRRKGGGRWTRKPKGSKG